MNTERHRRLVFVLIKFDTPRTTKCIRQKRLNSWFLEDKTLKLYLSLFFVHFENIIVCAKHVEQKLKYHSTMLSLKAFLRYYIFS